MKKIMLLAALVGAIALLQLYSCRPDNSNEIVPDTDNDISFNVPDGWPKPVYNFEGNTLSQAGFELGRKLFYDTHLSRDNTISCGSCHQQFAAFSHLDHPLSHGIEGKFGIRNSPGLFNLNWHPAFFWDGGVNHLEVQPINPIENPVEMDETLQNVVAKVSSDDTYKKMFQSAFGSTEVNTQRIFKALAQFMGAMVSSNSRYDKHERGEAGGSFTDQEERGLALFREKCASCHKEPLLSDFSYRNNGLVPNGSINDSGRARITQLADDIYKFKVPSLRNVGLSKPYMHDGRFNTLEEVLEHYATGIYKTPTLDPLLQNGISLSEQDKQDIKAFLLTLDDNEFIKDKRFAEP